MPLEVNVQSCFPDQEAGGGGAWGAGYWTRRALMEEALRALWGAEREDEPRSKGPCSGGELTYPDANLNKSSLSVIKNLPPSLGSK